MAKYLLKNWRTFPFKKKSFEGQLDRFVQVCVVSVENPNKILDVIPIYGKEDDYSFKDIIKLIHDIESGNQLNNDQILLRSHLLSPVEGEFVETKSLHGPLYRIHTREEAEYGLCSLSDIGKPYVTNEGTVKKYSVINVFTQPQFSISGMKTYVNGWAPSQMYYRYFRYKYFPISELNK